MGIVLLYITMLTDYSRVDCQVGCGEWLELFIFRLVVCVLDSNLWLESNAAWGTGIVP